MSDGLKRIARSLRRTAKVVQSTAELLGVEFGDPEAAKRKRPFIKSGKLGKRERGEGLIRGRGK